MDTLWETLCSAALLPTAAPHHKIAKQPHENVWVGTNKVFCFVLFAYTYVIIVVYMVVGPITQFLEGSIFPVLLPGIEALLKEVQKQDSYKVFFSNCRELNEVQIHLIKYSDLN